MGSWIEGEMMKVEGKTQAATNLMRSRTLQSILEDRESLKFADPAAKGK